MKATGSSLLKVFFLIMATVACSPSTVITGTWKSPGTVPPQYKSILVAAINANTVVRSSLEYDIAMVLSGSVKVLKSIDEFPPGIAAADSDKVTIMKNVKDKDVEAILTISLISKETRTRYVPSRIPYDPWEADPYYRNFWGYYSYWYPQVYDRGYYVQDKVYYIESNLYDVKTEKLVWSAQSKTYNPISMQTFSREFAQVIVSKMKKDRILRESADERMDRLSDKK